MTGERNIDTTAAEEEFSAAAPPHPGARGTGETSFGDAEAPAAGRARAAGTPAGDAPGQQADAPSAPAGDAPAQQQEPSAGAPAPAPEGSESVESAEQGASPETDKAAEYLALAKRTQADFENYRKRMARENAAAANRGAGKLAKELLPALDHLDLALKAAAGHEDVIRGFAMVRDELIAALGRVGIEAFSPRGEAFDPSEHEAMAQLPSEEAESGTVIEVYQQGYRINGTVLRPARVVVAQ